MASKQSSADRHYMHSNDENSENHSKYSGRVYRYSDIGSGGGSSSGGNNRGRESVNSLDDSSSRNSQSAGGTSGTTGGSIDGSGGRNGNFNSKQQQQQQQQQLQHHHSGTGSINAALLAAAAAAAASAATSSSNPANLSTTTTGSINNQNSVSISTLNNHLMGSTDTLSRTQRETLHSRFDFVKVLGKGTYGKVKLANDKRTGKQVAIKIIHKNRIENKQDLARVRREIEFMSRLNHPHIVKILEGKFNWQEDNVAIKLVNKSKINVKPRRLERIRREIDFMANINHPHIIKILEVYESSEKIILVMEYASGGELYDYLNERKRVSEVEARGIFRQIVSAVHFLHKNRIVHRDLKLENILIDSNGDIKLADFGLSNNWSPNSLLYTFCGSPLYASPEIVNGFPYFGPEVDCWSLGVLLYTLVYGSMPFQGGDYNRLVKQITDGQFIVPRERSGAFGLIKRCLCTKAAKRASIDDIAEHWWINVGYAYPPVVFYSYAPANGSARGGGTPGVQALGYEGSPKVSPSIPFGSLGKKNALAVVPASINNPSGMPPSSVY